MSTNAYPVVQNITNKNICHNICKPGHNFQPIKVNIDKSNIQINFVAGRTAMTFRSYMSTYEMINYRSLGCHDTHNWECQCS